MAKLIVKDGRLCIVNGRLVTDADGAPCVCDEPPPVNPIGCVLILTPCNTTDPAGDLWLLEFGCIDEALWPQLAAARVIYWAGVGCYAVVGYLQLEDGEEPPNSIPFLFVDNIAGCPDPTAFLDSCLDAPCGISQPICENCILPNRCITSTIAVDPWRNFYGVEIRVCAQRAILLSRLTWESSVVMRRVVPIAPQLNTINETIASASATSRTVFQAVGVNSFNITEHAFQRSGTHRRFEQAINGVVIEDQTINLARTETLTTAPKSTALASVAVNPFSIGDWDTGSPVGIGGNARYEPPPGTPGPSPVGRIVGWAQRTLNGNDAPVSWSWNTTTSGSCFRTIGSSSVSESATIQPLWGGATYSFQTAYESERRKDNSLGPGCPGVQEVIDTDVQSSRITESRQVLWLRAGSTLPDIRDGCPLTVLVVNCNDLNDRSAIDATGLVPLPDVVLLDRPGGPVCYLVLPIIVEEAPEVPVGFAGSCGTAPCAQEPPPPGGGSGGGDSPDGGEIGEPRGVAGLTRDEILDAMGFDPEEELRRVRAGGCCGQPTE